MFTAEFSETIAEAEVSAGDIFFAPAVQFTFTVSGSKITITLAEPPSASLTLTIDSVVDSFNNAMTDPFTHTFAPADTGILFEGDSTSTGPVVLSESSIGNPFLFHGREFDTETGLYHYRARAYDPHLARFLQHDPTGYSDGPNLYQGFLNNPTNYTDPFGLKVGSVSGCDPSNEQSFYKCAVKQIGEDEALEMYYLLFDTRAQQLAPGIIQAGQAIEETMKIQAIIAAAGFTGGAAGSLLGTEALAARLASCGIGGIGGQGMADLLNGSLSNASQYSETALEAMAACLGIEGGVWGLKQIGLLKSSTPVIGYPGAKAPRATAQYLINEAGVPLEADVRISGPHPHRVKGSRPDPVGGLIKGEHRGHLVPEGAVDNPRFVNVQENIISETPASNLGPKKSFDYLASRIAANNPHSEVRVVARPQRMPGQIRPHAVTYFVYKDGVPVYSVTIFNK